MTEGQSDVEAEARAAYAQLVATRGRIEAGELPWSALMDPFTDDAVLMDPAWGRTVGRDDLVDFFDRSMVASGDWTFPEVFTMVEEHRVVSMSWNRLPRASEATADRRRCRACRSCTAPATAASPMSSTP